MKRCFRIIAVAIVCGCGSAAPGPHPTTIVRTTTPPQETVAPDPVAQPSAEEQAALEELVARDAELAAELLIGAMDETDPDMAALAAIYALRLNIRRDEKKTGRALLNGVRSSDYLIACLSWRWLVVLTEIKLPAQKKHLDDPLIHLFISLAHASRGTPPPPTLSSALAASHRFGPGDIAADDSDDNLARLRRETIAVDDGALALAIAFHEARRDGVLETIANAPPRPVAFRYRTALLDFLALNHVAIENDIAADYFSQSRIRRLLVPSVALPLADLRRLCVEGRGSLQREALLALGFFAVSPLSGDFAAARAGMESVELRNRIEAARTYLLLTARATRREP